MIIQKIRHLWPEKDGFFLQRPTGTEEFVLLHFLSPVEIFLYGETIRTEPGAFILFEPGVPYNIMSVGPLVHDWIHITGPVREAAEAVGLSPNTVYYPGCSQVISDIVEQLEIDFFSDRIYSQEMAECKLRELLICVSRGVLAGSTRTTVPKETELRLKQVRAAMMGRPEEEWPVERMAAMAGLSSSRLYTVYKEIFGISPNRDLILLRLEKARFLLMQGCGVSETAEETGYASVSHFIRQFHRETGMTPRAFAAKRGISGEAPWKTRGDPV